MKPNDSGQKRTAPARSPRRDRKDRAAQTEPAKPPDGLEELLDYLERTRGFSFTSYKRSTLARRIQKRMQEIGLSDCADYIDYLEVHPEEFATLFNTILINMTDFFRDPATWQFLSEEVIPRILQGKGPTEAVRIWSAGTSSGEEAYSIAMLMAEAIGSDSFGDRVKIYGTDADEEALNQARQATYDAERVKAVPPELLKKYFLLAAGRYTFDKKLRRSIIFGRHDLIQDSPISRVDLIICRNTLMYFNAETQARILARFGFALNDGGMLFLGKAETLLTRLNMFTPVDVKRRVFSKLPRVNQRDRLVLAAEGLADVPLNHMPGDQRLRDVAFDMDPVAQIVVDMNGVVVIINDSARALFGLTVNDVGRPLQDLEISYRPVELRSLIRQTFVDRRPSITHDVQMPGPGGAHYFDLTIIPLFDGEGDSIGAKAMFADITRTHQLRQELQVSRQELETAYEELQSANEELETTNEELQSTVEELETTNEELQSTNEELETMNEELQSTNEELEAANEQLRQRGEEAHGMNELNEAILSNMLQGMIVVNSSVEVTAWNRRAEDLWGLRADEVQGKHLLNLDIGLPVDHLKQPIRAILSGESKLERVQVQAINRRGRSIQITVFCTPLDHESKPRGVILVMEEKQDEREEPEKD